MGRLNSLPPPGDILPSLEDHLSISLTHHLTSWPSDCLWDPLLLCLNDSGIIFNTLQGHLHHLHLT